MFSIENNREIGRMAYLGLIGRKGTLAAVKTPRYGLFGTFHGTSDIFRDTPGVKLGGKTGINCGNIVHLLPNSYKNLHIWSDMILNMTNLMLASTFAILEFLDHLGLLWDLFAIIL